VHATKECCLGLFGCCHNLLQITAPEIWHDASSFGCQLATTHFLKKITKKKKLSAALLARKKKP
jgi:hypothetical protein